MTISSTIRKAGPFSGTGAQIAYPFAFKVFATADVRVVLTDPYGIEIDQVESSQYTVALNDNQDANPGGSVTMLASPPIGYLLTIGSSVKPLQGQSIPNNGGFYPKVIENALDRLTISVQQITESVSRSFKLAFSDTGNGDLPAAAARANKLLSFDGAGNPIAIAPVSGTATALQLLLGAINGSSLIGWFQSGTGAVMRWVQDKLRERVSIADFGAGTGLGDAAKDTAAILAAIFAVKQAFYDKGSACLHFPTPQVPYRLNQTIDLTEVWNLTISTGNGFFFQRFATTVDPLTDNALLQWFGAAGGTMMRLHYTFGFASNRISFNGRNLAKFGVDVAPATSTASTTRKVDLNDLCVKNCDFGVRVGDLAAQTDNAPVTIDRFNISGCTSTAILVASGNAAVNINNGFLINNGFAPSSGNSFIANGDNIGTHLTILAGFVSVNNLVTDHDTDHPLAGAAVYQTNGGFRANGFWCDDPSKPAYKGSADRGIFIQGLTHYDGSMTAASTPNSIEYSGPSTLFLAGSYLYGNVQITSGNQASVDAHGVTFGRAGAGFTGDMVTTYGGLAVTGKTANNSLATSIGGDFPKDVGGFHAHTVWAPSGTTGLVRATTGAFSYKVTETLTNGQMMAAGNAYFDGTNWRAIKGAAPCWRHTYGIGVETFESSAAATNAGDVVTWIGAHGWLPGVGANAIPILSAAPFKMTWDSAPPSAGAWTRGDRVFNLAVAVGAAKGWICTVSGTPGTWVSEGNL